MKSLLFLLFHFEALPVRRLVATFSLNSSDQMPTANQFMFRTHSLGRFSGGGASGFVIFFSSSLILLNTFSPFRLAFQVLLHAVHLECVCASHVVHFWPARTTRSVFRRFALEMKWTTQNKNRTMNELEWQKKMWKFSLLFFLPIFRPILGVCAIRHRHSSVASHRSRCRRRRSAKRFFFFISQNYT